MADSPQTPHVDPIREAGSRPKLLDQVRQTIRMRHYSRRTEATYVHWIRRFIVFHHKEHPSTMGAPEIMAFLSWLATSQRVGSSTQNQALSAVLFLYRHVLRIEIGAIEQVPRAKLPHRVPVVLSREEAGMIFKHVQGTMWMVVALLYGAGLRLQECLELRVKDLDFDRHEITVRRGKGQKDRRTMLPVAIEARLKGHLREVRQQHERDLADGFGRVVLPFALDRKYPNAATDWAWQFVFPASRICRDPRWGPPSRFHLHESAVQREVANAVRRAGITKRVGPHCFRHSFATHLLELSGSEVRRPSSVHRRRLRRTTEHAANRGEPGGVSGCGKSLTLRQIDARFTRETPALAAGATLRSLVSGPQVLPMIGFSSWGLPRFRRAPTEGVGRERTPDCDANCSHVGRSFDGTTGALISEHFRARLRAPSSAMAASRASRSTQ